MGSLVWKVEMMCSEKGGNICAHIPSCGMFSNSTSASAVTGGSVEFCTALAVDGSINPLVSWGLKVLGNEERACKMGKTAWKYLLKVLGEGKGENFRAPLLSIRYSYIFSHGSAESGTLSKTLTWPDPVSHCPHCHLGLMLPLPCAGEHLYHSLPHLQVCPSHSVIQMLPWPHQHSEAQMKANEVSGPFCGWR